MKLIALPGKVRKVYKLYDGKAKWCYLGKDITKRESISKILGEENRFYLKDRLQKIAMRYRQPYIDFVAALGEGQQNQLNWWASKFSSKMPMQTDFFLLFCYKVLADKLAQKGSTNDNLIIFIEDFWLFTDIKKRKSQSGVICMGCPNLFLIKVLSFLRGILRRLFLMGWFIVAWFLMLLCQRGKKPEAVMKAGKALCIINPAEPRAFKDGQYVNNYMPGLSKFCQKQNIPFFYLYLLRFPLLTLKHVGMNSNILWPLILDIRISDVIKRIFHYWKPDLDKKKNCIGEHDVLLLLKREIWLEFSSAGFNVLLMVFDTLNSFFKKAWSRSVIYVFENQTWEKMLCMAARENNVKISGYQHSSIWRLFLSQFIGEKEGSFMPLPHRLITSGSYFARLYKEGRMPEEKIVVGGSWRYLVSMANQKSNAFVKKDFTSKKIALVSLNIDTRVTMSMLTSIIKILSKGHLKDELEFWVKPHPGATRHELYKMNNLISQFKVVEGAFDRLLDDVDIVIASTSTSGLEAFLHGKKVVSYIPENLLAADPLLDMEDKAVYKWYEGEELNLDLLKDFHPPRGADEMDEMKEKYFGKIDQSVWAEACGGGNKL